MKRRKLNQRPNKCWSLLCMIMAVYLILTGCASFGPVSLNKAMIQYDDNVLQSEKQLLLLNIIRMHDDQPPHFTVATDIKATFKLSYNGGLSSSITNNSSSNIFASILTLGTTVSDEPTITIAPMQGEKFAERFIKPMDTSTVNTILLHENISMIDKMLRLMGDNFLIMSPDLTEKLFNITHHRKYTEKFDFPNEVVKYLKTKTKECFDEKSCLLVNRPPIQLDNIKKEDIEDNVNSYSLFREVVLHLEVIALTGNLQVFPLNFDISKKQNAGEAKGKGKEKEKETNDSRHYSFTALSNFDITSMGEKDKKNYLAKIQSDLELDDYYNFGEDVIIVLIRGDENNHWPIYGLFGLRNFKQVLNFLAESLKDQFGYAREFDVAPNQFTKELMNKKPLKCGRLDNPALTLKINSGTTTPPRDRFVDVDYNGESFWIPSQIGISRWDKQVFSMLYEIFQFNRVEPDVSAPSVTIAK